MRIGVDAVPLQKLHGGVSYYIFFLLDELVQLRPNDSFFLFINQESTDIQYFTKYKNVTISICSPSLIGHSIWAQTALSYACWIKAIDVFWGTTQSIPLLKKARMKTLFTLHDFVYLLCPETMSIYKKTYLKVFSRWMFKRADAILPNSKGTGEKLKKLYGIDYHTVIHPPLKSQVVFKEDPAEFLRSHHLLPKKYLITIGTLEPRKNFQKLIEVFLLTLEQHSPEKVLPLVIVGGGGWKNRELVEVLALAKKKYPDHFYLMGYRTDEEIAYLLSGALYCLMVSKYEGYGMPLSESRMCRTRVICLDQPEMREAAENDGIFLNSKTWETEIKRYLLSTSETRNPRPVQYLSNKEKAVIISEIIDSFGINALD